MNRAEQLARLRRGHLDEDEELHTFDEPHRVPQLASTMTEDEGENVSGPAVLREIVEREATVSATPLSRHTIALGAAEHGFPRPFKLSLVNTHARTDAGNDSGKPRKSLFAQQRERELAESQRAKTEEKRENDSISEIQTSSVTRSSPSPPPPRSQSRPLSPPSPTSRHVSVIDVDAIRAENDSRIASMTADDIAEAQAEIASVLNPSLIAALRKRAMKHSDDKAAEAAFNRQFGQVLSTVASAAANTSTNTDNQPSTIDNSKYSVTERTAWMAPITEPTPTPDWSHLDWSTGIGVEAHSLKPDHRLYGTAWDFLRFDFAGVITETNTGTDSDSDGYGGLHHHGAQPDRAGYTISEIIHLAHSTVPAQRATMLGILTNIIANIHSHRFRAPSGVIARVANIDFNALMLEHAMVLGVVTTIRLMLDDSNLTVITAAIKALAAMIDSDSLSIDRMLEGSTLWHGRWCHAPILTQHARKHWPVFDSTPCHDDAICQHFIDSVTIVNTAADGDDVDSDSVTDNHDDESLAMTDLLCALVRMNLLPRINFLINNYFTDSASVVAMLAKILTVIAYHSPVSASAIIATPGLIDSITALAKSHSNPYLLLTLAACFKQSRSLALSLSNSGALTALKESVLRANGLPGQIAPTVTDREVDVSTASLVVWRASLSYGLDVSDFLAFFPVLMTTIAKPTLTLTNTGAISDSGSGSAVHQLRAMWNIFEGLCENLSLLHSNTDTNGDSDADISLTHLVSGVDHALSQLPSLLSSPHASPTLLAGMIHFIASYYTALSAPSHRHLIETELLTLQLAKHQRQVFDLLLTFPVIQSAYQSLTTAGAHASTNGHHGSCRQLYCFPIVDHQSLYSGSGSVSGDLLLSVGRWLRAELTLALELKVTDFVSALAQSPLIPRLVTLVTTLTSIDTTGSGNDGDMPLIVAMTVLEYLTLLQQLWGKSWETKLTQPLYHSALTVMPVLVSYGRVVEADTLLRHTVLSPASLVWLQSQSLARWQSLYRASKCSMCEWSTKDFVSAPQCHHTLSTIYHSLLTHTITGTSSDNGSEWKHGKSLVSGSLSQRQSLSKIAIHGPKPAVDWLLAPLRHCHYVLSVPNITAEHAVKLTRALLHYLCWLCDTGILMPNQHYALVVRAVMELLLNDSAEMCSDPALHYPLTHLTHTLSSSLGSSYQFDSGALNSVRGWGGNFFPVYQLLISRLTSEGVNDSNFLTIVLYGLSQSLPVDYRLLFWTEIETQARTINDARMPGRLSLYTAPVEKSAELLAIYRRLIAGPDPAIIPHTDLFNVVAHHLLASWCGADGLSDRSVREEKVRSRGAGKLSEAVMQAMMEYRPSTFH